MQNCVSKIRENNKLAKNRFFEDTLSPIKIIENFSQEDDDKENRDPNTQILITKDEISVESATLKPKYIKRRVFKELYEQKDEKSDILDS